MVITDIQQVKDAADLLEELSRLYDLGSPKLVEWSADDLRAEIPHIQDHIDHGRIVQEITDSVRVSVMSGAMVEDAIKSVLAEYEIRVP